MINELIILEQYERYTVKKFKMAGKYFVCVYDNETGRIYFHYSVICELFNIPEGSFGNKIRNIRFRRVHLKTNRSNQRLSFYDYDTIINLVGVLGSQEAYDMLNALDNSLRVMNIYVNIGEDTMSKRYVVKKMNNGFPCLLDTKTGKVYFNINTLGKMLGYANSTISKKLANCKNGKIIYPGEYGFKVSYYDFDCVKGLAKTSNRRGVSFIIEHIEQELNNMFGGKIKPVDEYTVNIDGLDELNALEKQLEFNKSKISNLEEKIKFLKLENEDIDNLQNGINLKSINSETVKKTVMKLIDMKKTNTDKITVLETELSKLKSDNDTIKADITNFKIKYFDKLVKQNSKLYKEVEQFKKGKVKNSKGEKNIPKKAEFILRTPLNGKPTYAIRLDGKDVKVSQFFCKLIDWFVKKYPNVDLEITVNDREIKTYYDMKKEPRTNKFATLCKIGTDGLNNKYGIYMNGKFIKRSTKFTKLVKWFNKKYPKCELKIKI